MQGPSELYPASHGGNSEQLPQWNSSSNRRSSRRRSRRRRRWRFPSGSLAVCFGERHPFSFDFTTLFLSQISITGFVSVSKTGFSGCFVVEILSLPLEAERWRFPLREWEEAGRLQYDERINTELEMTIELKKITKRATHNHKT